MRFGKLLLVVAAGGVLAFPAVAAAQSSFAGQVTDNTGGVLPGVTVEASSPALIEGSRIAITDGAGLYNIIDLRPGTYAISFTLPGFGTQIRDQLELPADVTLNIDVAMSVGGIEETVTVSGEAPVVDVQQVQRVEVLTREVQEAIPTGRSMWSYALLIPGVKVHKPDVGGTSGAQQSTMTGRGLDGRHTTVQMDGIMINTLIDDGQFQAYLNPMLSAETSYTTTGINAETQTGGLRINMIPAEGGNNYSGQFFGGGTPARLAAKNWNHRLGALGIKQDGLPEIVRIYDFNAAVGGPVFRDRLWFFSTARRNVIDNAIANSFKRDGTRGIDDNSITSAATRLTWQMDDNNKLSAMFDKVRKRRFHQHTIVQDVATVAGSWTSPHYDTGQAKWTSTISSRMLAEFGFSIVYEDWDPGSQPMGPVGLGGESEPISRERPAGAGVCTMTPCFWPVGSSEANMQLITGDPWYRIVQQKDAQLNNFEQGAKFWDENNYSHRWTYTGSLSYVTGSHNFKFGFMSTLGNNRFAYTTNADIGRLGYRNDPHPQGQIIDWLAANCSHYANQDNVAAGRPCGLRGAPDYILATNLPSFSRHDLDYNGGIYAQDSWTIDRLTLNYGLRMDIGRASVPATPKPGGRFVDTFEYPAVPYCGSGATGNVTDYCLPTFGPDWSPRFSAAYDLFGDARTALKFGWNKYVRDLGANYPRSYSVATRATDNRDWFDQHLCYMVGGACNNAMRGSGAGEWAPSGMNPYGSNWDNIAQDWEIGDGREAFGFRSPNTPDLGLLREYNEMWTVGIQQELTTGISLNAEFRRRTFHNTQSVDNILRSFGDFGAGPDGTMDPAFACSSSLTSGCHFQFLRPYPFAGAITVFNIDNAIRQQTSDLVNRTRPADYTQIYTGFELSLQARFDNGGVLFGGWSVEDQGRLSFAYDEFGGAGARFGGEANNCPDTISIGDNPNDLWFCDARAYPRPYRHEFKLNGTYPFTAGPLGDWQVAGSFQAYPGESQNWGGFAEGFRLHRTSSNALLNTYDPLFYGHGNCVAPCNLGGSIFPDGILTAGTGTTSLWLPMVPLNSVKFAAAWTQLDVNLQKVFNIGSWRYDARIEVFNALNNGVEIWYTGSRQTDGVTGAGIQTGSAFERVEKILEGRVIRFAVTARF